MKNEPQYAGFIGECDHLSPAPKLFHIYEKVDPSMLPTPDYAERLEIPPPDKTGYHAFDLSKGTGLIEISSDEIPKTEGTIVGVAQLKRGGSGFINVRWGQINKPGTILAQYCFGYNKNLDKGK